MRQGPASIPAIAALAFLGTAPASAQTSGSETATPARSPAAAGQRKAAKSPGDVTCGEMSRMDTMMVPAMLYFIAGHEQARQDSGAASGTPPMPPAASEGTAPVDATAGNVVPVVGFYPIPVEETMIVWGQAPSRRAADVLREHQQAAPATH